MRQEGSQTQQMAVVKEASPQKIKNMYDLISFPAGIQSPSSWKNSPDFLLKKHPSNPCSLNRLMLLVACNLAYHPTLPATVTGLGIGLKNQHSSGTFVLATEREASTLAMTLSLRNHINLKLLFAMDPGTKANAERGETQEMKKTVQKMLLSLNIKSAWNQPVLNFPVTWMREVLPLSKITWSSFLLLLKQMVQIDVVNKCIDL